jgi:hypothetical protein
MEEVLSRHAYMLHRTARQGTKENWNVTGDIIKTGGLDIIV